MQIGMVLGLYVDFAMWKYPLAADTTVVLMYQYELLSSWEDISQDKAAEACQQLIECAYRLEGLPEPAAEDKSTATPCTEVQSAVHSIVGNSF